MATSNVPEQEDTSSFNQLPNKTRSEIVQKIFTFYLSPHLVEMQYFSHPRYFCIPALQLDHMLCFLYSVHTTHIL